MEVIFKNVSFTYNDDVTDEKYALKNINIDFQSNLIHGIIGPTGSGKSTMLELMNGLVKPTKGEVIIGKYNLSRKNFNFNDFRYKVGLVYQFPEKQFICQTVGEEILFSQKFSSKKNKKLESRLIKILKMVGLNETYVKRNPFSLNNGEKRLVAIASVLISNPKLLIMDEPTIGLDNNSKKRLMRSLLKLKNEYGKTIIIVTHDVDMLYEIVDNVIILNNGLLVKEGDKVDVFSSVEILKKNNTPIPSIIKIEKLIYDKIGIDLGYLPNINSLVREINKVKKGVAINE